MAVDKLDLWRQIPPEEKIQQISRAQAKGAVSAFIAIIIGCSIAVGLQIESLIWVSIIISPFIFQFTAGKAWRGAKPRMMLEYLAARSAGRRYAYSSKARQLGVDLIFRGDIEEIDLNRPAVEDMVSALETGVESATSWIVLLNDCVVGMKERPGGAEMLFSYQIDDRMMVEGADAEPEEIVQNGITLTSVDDNSRGYKYNIKCEFPAVMLAFEQKLRASRKEVVARINRHEKMLAELRNRVAN